MKIAFLAPAYPIRGGIAQYVAILAEKLEERGHQIKIFSFIKQYPDADRIVLKSKSPSCGLGTTPILNTQKEKLHNGNGIAADIFQKQYQNTLIEDENSYI